MDELLLNMKNVLMLPFSSVLHTFPRLVVRELSRDQAKEVDLVIEGGEIEVDRRILEEIKDLLLHLIRNCVDHGIEKPAEREQNNKPRLGTIKIAISQLDGSKVQVLISDNGRGMDRVKIKVSALKLGLIAQAEADGLSDPETFALVFRSGVSSSAIITIYQVAVSVSPSFARKPKSCGERSPSILRSTAAARPFVWFCRSQLPPFAAFPCAYTKIFLSFLP